MDIIASFLHISNLHMCHVCGIFLGHICCWHMYDFSMVTK